MVYSGRAETVFEQNRRRSVGFWFAALALFLHVGGGGIMVPITRALERRFFRPPPRPNILLLEDVQRRREPPPPPPPPPPPAAVIPPEPDRAAHRDRPVPQQQPEQRPAPTRAAPIMVVQGEQSNEDPDDQVAVGDNLHATGDVSSDGVVRGPGQGVTGAARGGAVVAAPPAPPAPPVRATPPPIDYAAPARLECDPEAARDHYPDAAREAGIFEQRVRLRVEVDGAGRILRVRALNDPGYGFVAAAEQVVRSFCHVTSARDRAGTSVAYTIESFSVNFVVE